MIVGILCHIQKVILKLRQAIQKIKYSQFSTNRHSCKWTVLPVDTSSIPLLPPYSNCFYLFPWVDTLLWPDADTFEMKISFFFCVHSLVSGHSMDNNWLLAIEMCLNFANQQKISTLTWQQNSGDQFRQISICLPESTLSVHLTITRVWHNTLSWVGIHPCLLWFPLVT